jgi:pSer/pThr/pTyr-binding forkhead associated (FHA) protein
VDAGSTISRLVAIAGPLKGSSFPLEQRQFAIGRDDSNQLIIADNTISRRHCVLERTADGVVVRDLGSRAGTLVNGTATAEVLLQHGDRLAVGDSAFMFLAEASEPEFPLVELYDQAVSDDSTVQLDPAIFGPQR